MGSDVAKQEAVVSEEVEPQAKDVVRWKRLLLAIWQEIVKTKQPGKSISIQGIIIVRLYLTSIVDILNIFMSNKSQTPQSTIKQISNRSSVNGSAINIPFPTSHTIFKESSRMTFWLFFGAGVSSRQANHQAGLWSSDKVSFAKKYISAMNSPIPTSPAMEQKFVLFAVCWFLVPRRWD